MNIEISRTDLQKLLFKQLDNLFGLEFEAQQVLIRSLDAALERTDRCFEQNQNRYYKRDRQVYFNPFHSTQYMIFLYYLSNTIYANEPTASILCDKIYYLNKSLNGIDLFYTVELPDFFMAEHPVGTVIGGKGKIGSGFLFYRGCTLGGFHESDGTISYPDLGENVRMYAHSSIIGRSKIGDNVNIGAGAFVKNENIPDNVNVFGQSPNLIIKPRKLIVSC